MVRAPGSDARRSGQRTRRRHHRQQKHHGGDDQAVYAYAREDLDDWEVRLRRVLGDGNFGENLTTVGRRCDRREDR